MPNPYLAAVLKEQQEKQAALPPTKPEGYQALKVAELNEVIDLRNEGRDEASLIVPSGAKKADLIEALEADDSNNPTSEES